MKPSERSLEGVMAELKALRQAYGDAQRRCSAMLQRLHARNQALEAEVLQLRAQLAAREPSMVMAGDEQRRMVAAARMNPPGRAGLSARIESLAQRLQALLRGASGTDVDLPTLPDAMCEPTPFTQQATEAEHGCPAAARPVDARPVAVQQVSPGGGVASTSGAGCPLHPEDKGRMPDVTDDFEDPPDLEERLVEADLVICQTGCLSHQAYWRVQDHCRRHNKPCVLVAQPDALRIIRIHQRDETAFAGAVPVDGGSGVRLMAGAGMPDATVLDGRTGADAPGQGPGSEARTMGHRQESGVTG